MRPPPPALLSLSHSRPRPFERGGMIVLAGGGVAEAQQGPVARGHVPREPAVFAELRRQVHDAFAGGRPRPQRQRNVVRSGISSRVSADLPRRCGNDVVRRRRGKGKHRDVAIEILVTPSVAAARRRTAAAATTLVSVQTMRCMDSSGVIQGPPLPHQPASLFMFTSSPSRCASAQMCLKRSRHSGPAKAAGPWARPGRSPCRARRRCRRVSSLPDRRDAVAGDVAVQREPIHPRARGWGWVPESGLQFI